jgi:outer membrane receptor protein involved in Fe transport
MAFRGLLLGTAAVLMSVSQVRAAEADAGFETVIVTGRASDLTGIASSANQGTVGAADLDLRPLLRPGEIVENIPGVIITQHSGSGKANQYFLRGFNLDHGTDLAIHLDGMPVNMPSHGHGQGYSDLNFAIPELIQRVDYKKGPYYADVGDFGSAGAFDIHYYDVLPTGIARVEGGQYGYGRAFLANNAGVGAGNMIYALEFEHNDGPWDKGDDARKIGGMLRYSEGDAQNGWTIAAMAYHNIWNSTDQVAQRAIRGEVDAVGAPAPAPQYQISRWGELDNSDGGKTGRYSLSGDWRQSTENSRLRISAYGLYYDLDLFSNFTYFLDDPVRGDQFEQQDARYVFGGAIDQAWDHDLFGAASTTTVGLQVRDDEIRNGLFHTERRQRLSADVFDRISESNAGLYVQNQTHWTPWLRSILGLRGDVFRFDVSNLAGAGNSDTVTASMAEPKVGLIFGPWADTEFYLNGGFGYHSNDARGVVDAAGPAVPLARTKGAEVGIRTTAIPNLQSSLTLWTLHIQSELTWEGDAGDTAPSGPTDRIGVEFANFYTPTPWLTVDADFAWSHARYTAFDPAGQRVPESLEGTIDAGVALHDLDGWAKNWSGGLRLRYFGPRNLTQDGLVHSKATSLVYANLGYQFAEDWTVGLSIFNLFDNKASDIDYFYTSRLPGEPAGGVDDIHTHPAEPREFRLSITKKL